MVRKDVEIKFIVAVNLIFVIRLDFTPLAQHAYQHQPIAANLQFSLDLDNVRQIKEVLRNVFARSDKDIIRRATDLDANGARLGLIGIQEYT